MTLPIYVLKLYSDISRDKAVYSIEEVRMLFISTEMQEW